MADVIDLILENGIKRTLHILKTNNLPECIIKKNDDGTFYLEQRGVLCVDDDGIFYSNCTLILKKVFLISGYDADKIKSLYDVIHLNYPSNYKKEILEILIPDNQKRW